MATSTKKPFMRPTTGALAKAIPTFGPNTDQEKMAAALGSTGHGGSMPATKAGFQAAEEAASAREYVIGQTYNIPLTNLQKSALNARIFYDGEELDEMSKSLQKEGQDVPAIGYMKDGRVVLVDGQKRFQAATIASLPSLEVKIVVEPENARAEYEESRRINLTRSSQTALDDALRWKELLANGTYSDQEDLAKSLGVSVPNVSKTLAINKIPERLIRMMNEHEQTRAMTIAYEVSQIFGAAKFRDQPEEAANVAQDVIEEIKRKDLGRTQTKALIDSKIEGPKTRERAEQAPVKYGESKGVLKVFPSRGQLDLSFRDLPEQKVNELKGLIEKLLTGQMPL